MQNAQDLKTVQELRNALSAGDEERLKAQRDAGKQTARQRIEKFVDSGSFVELFALVSDGGDAAGVITGYATVQGRPVYLFAQDFTVHGGAMGTLQALKINKMLELALKTGAPVVALLDSAGVRIDEGAAGMNAYAEIYKNIARLSGVSPIVAVVLGPVIGGAALITQLADVSVMAKKVGSLMVFGPQVLAAMNGMDVKAEALGGADMMAAQGGVSLVAATEDEALTLASQVLALLPSCNAEDAELTDGDDLNRLLPDVAPGDTDALLNAVLDAGTLLELKPAYETGVRTALGRMGGRSVGVVAAGGALTAGALQKAARFVHFLDCFNIPVVSFLSTDGVKVDRLDNQSWLMNAQSQLLYAYATATVPKLAVVTGNAIGQAYVAMGGKANADVCFAWPGAVISALTPQAAVAVLYAEQVKADKALAPAEARAKYADEYVQTVAGALCAAKAGLVDDVIDPAQTRKMLIASLEMLASKRDSNPAKKHGNMPL